MSKILTPEECKKIVFKENSKNWNAQTKLAYLKTICDGCDYTVERKGGMIIFSVRTYNDIMELSNKKGYEDVINELKNRVYIAIDCATKMGVKYREDSWSYPALDAYIEVDSTVDDEL